MLSHSLTTQKCRIPFYDPAQNQADMSLIVYKHYLDCHVIFPFKSCVCFFCVFFYIPVLQESRIIQLPALILVYPCRQIFPQVLFYPYDAYPVHKTCRPAWYELPAAAVPAAVWMAAAEQPDCRFPAGPAKLSDNCAP